MRGRGESIEKEREKPPPYLGQNGKGCRSENLEKVLEHGHVLVEGAEDLDNLAAHVEAGRVVLSLKETNHLHGNLRNHGRRPRVQAADHVLEAAAAGLDHIRVLLEPVFEVRNG